MFLSFFLSLFSMVVFCLGFMVFMNILLIFGSQGNHPQEGRRFLHYRNDPKFLNISSWANSVDPDETALQGLHRLPFHLHL